MEALRIRIPERYQSGMAKLISLPDSALEELVLILNEIPRSLNLNSIKEYIVSKVSTMLESEVDELIGALDSLYYIKSQSDISVQDFSEQVLQAMNETGNKALQVEPSVREPFKERLIRLMSGKLLRIAIKSRDVLYEQERTFGSAIMLSDIRLIFEEAGENNPDTAIIVHTLKIHYFQNDQHNEFFVSLDVGDVDSLIETLIRAKEKTETLKSILAAADVPYIDAE